VGKVINRFKVGKHFTIMIDDGTFSFSLKEESIRRESDLDGIYVIRTSESAERISAEDTVCSYKRLEQVESGAIRCMKGVRLTSKGFKIHSFQTLLAELATRSRNRCRVKSDPAGPTFYELTEPDFSPEKGFSTPRLVPSKRKIVSRKTYVKSIKDPFLYKGTSV